VTIISKASVLWRKSSLGVAVIIALLMGGYAYWTGEDAPQFRTAEVQRGTVEVTVLAAGTIKAAQLVSVGARVSGQINELAVRLGQDVAAGDVIAQIDREEQANEVLRAKAALAQISAQIAAKSAGLRRAQTTLARQTQLGAAELISKEALENVAAEVDVLRAELTALQAQQTSAEVTVAQAEIALDRATVTAPISGTVVAIVAEQGQTVSAAQNAPTIIKLANLETMVINAEISEADVVRVAAGQSASFTILGDPDARFDAVLREVEPAPTQLVESDTIEAGEAIYFNGILEVANPDRKLRIGMTAQVSIILDRAQDVLTIPSGALQTGPDGAMVQVLENGRAVDRPVTAGLDDKVNVEITSGLEAGELVILGMAAAGDGAGGARRMGPPMGLR
jgi:membrane fusion protein, macrolide-specific efflux system